MDPLTLMRPEPMRMLEMIFTSENYLHSLETIYLAHFLDFELKPVPYRAAPLGEVSKCVISVKSLAAKTSWRKMSADCNILYNPTLNEESALEHAIEPDFRFDIELEASTPVLLFLICLNEESEIRMAYLSKRTIP